jgi:hypothetical protein
LQHQENDTPITQKSQATTSKKQRSFNHIHHRPPPSNNRSQRPFQVITSRQSRKKYFLKKWEKHPHENSSRTLSLSPASITIT